MDMVLESENVDVVVDVLVSVLAAWAGRDRGAHKEWHFFGSIFFLLKKHGPEKKSHNRGQSPMIARICQDTDLCSKKNKNSQ